MDDFYYRMASHTKVDLQYSQTFWVISTLHRNLDFAESFDALTCLHTMAGHKLGLECCSIIPLLFRP